MTHRPIARRAWAVACAAALVAVSLTGCGGAAKTDDHAAGEAVTFDQKLASEGKTIANANGCIACHSIDGKAGVGPTWKSLYGHDVTLLDGSKVKANDAYLKESIVNPSAKVVKGFTAGSMPNTFGQTLKDGQIAALVEYMKSLH